MSLTKAEKESLKKQLKEQVESLTPDKRLAAEQQIESLSEEAMEEMIAQQKEAPPIFRKIIQGEIPSIKVGENSDCIAVLDNKPISKGHIVIIPKSPAQNPKKIPQSAFALAQTLTDKIVSNLKAKSAKAHTETKFGESIINLIPIYDKDLTISSKRSESSLEELEAVKKSLEVIKIEKNPEIIKKEKPKKVRPLKLNRRIP